MLDHQTDSDHIVRVSPALVKVLTDDDSEEIVTDGGGGR
jgi:hypothetical protein